MTRLNEQFVLEIHEIYFFDGAGEGRIEPFQIVRGEEILPEGIVDEYAAPLAALGFVAGDGISIFQLQGVEERILPDGIVAFLLGGKMRIVLADTQIKGVRLLVGQAG